MLLFNFLAMIVALKQSVFIHASSYASDNSFCGESWSDASSNCDDRQPCSYGTDRECSVPGHVCFGDTTCSVKAGHGEKFKYEKLVAVASTDYNDITNTMFCGDWWGGAEENCSVQSHCTDFLEGCFAVQENCFETPCNIHDIAEAELGKNWKLKVTGKDDGGVVEVSKLSPDDKRRNNFCGVNWAQASTNCNQWCAGTNRPGECPGGERCFADTLCYFDADLQPTTQPIATLAPTKSPLLYSDPTNESFCGSSWALATQNCSPKTHCKEDSDCRRQGHKCWHLVPGCHLADMERGDTLQQNPAKNELPEDLFLKKDPKNFRFCGTDYDDAKENCHLGRHCPNLRCSEPLRCFIDLQYVGGEHCNAYDMIRGHTRQPTDKPTSPPTPEPTLSPSTPPTTSNPTMKPTKHPTMPPTKLPTTRPTKFPLTNAPVPVVHGLCAESFEELQQIYRTARKCSNINPCDLGQLCFPNVDVVSFATGPPSAAPTLSPITSRPTTGKPTPSPTNQPTSSPSSTPTLSPVHEKPTSPPSPSPSTPFPTYWYTSFSPTQKQTSAGKNPSNAQKDTQKPTDRMETSEPTDQRETQMPSNTVHTQKPMTSGPVAQEKRQKPTARPTAQSDTQMPATQKDTPVTKENISKKKKFFCAASVKELKSSCGSSPECDFSRPCPPGLGCIQFDGCKHTGQKPPNSGALWNIFPDLCPLGFVGLHAPAGDCQQYYDCRDGFLHASFLCESGLMFENSRAECISQKLVNSKCETVDTQQPDLTLVETNKDQNHPPGSGKGYNYISQLGSASDGGKEEMKESGKESEINTLPGGRNSDMSLLVNGKDQMNKMENQQIKFGKENSDTASEPNAFTEIEESYSGNYQPGNLAESEGDPQILLAPPDSFSMCPSGFIGFHAKTDCSKYYECNDGAMSGPVHTCMTSYKFDKVRGHCISGELVSEFCYGPALEMEVDEGQSSTTYMPSPAPAPEGTPTASPNGQVGAYAGGAFFSSSKTVSPTSPMSESDWSYSSSPTKKKYTLWLRNYENRGGRTPSLGKIICWIALCPILIFL